MKGLLSGGVWGVIIGGLAVSTASLVSEQPAGNTPPAAPQVSAPESAGQDDAQSSPPEQVAEAPEPAAAPESAPRVATPQVDVQSPIADTTSAALPDTGVVTVAPTPPVAGETPDIAVAPEDPVLPNPQSVAPQVPLAEDDLVVATTPAAPPIVVELPAEETVAENDAQDAQVEAAQEPLANAPAEDAAPVIDTDSPEVAVIETPETDPAPAAPADDTVAQVVAPEAPVAPETDTAAVVDPIAPEPAPEPEPETETAAAPAVVTIIAEPAPGLPVGTGTVRINRPTTEEAVEIATEEETIVDPDAPAIERYGLTGLNPDSKPTVAVILIDDGSFAGAVPALAGIPFPVTVMLNPGSPDATEKMLAYRAAGIEVGILAQLPDGAQPSDVEVFFEAAFATLPETVAVLDAGNAGLQSGSIDVITQTVTAVADDGRGLITVSQGLNSTVREAEKLGVPTGTVYRDLDGEGQDARVIRRFMDQAAFRARQESGVVLLGRVRADTISALILWGTANRAGQVALVPVTTIFNDQ